MERFLTLRNEHGVEQDELFLDGLDPDQGLLDRVLHGVPGFFEAPSMRREPVPGFFDAGAVALLPHRQRHSQRQAQGVLALIRRERPEDVRRVAAGDVHQREARGEAGPEVHSGQLDRVLTRLDQRRRRQHLLPVPLSQAHQMCPVQGHRRRLEGGNGRDGGLRGPGAERVEVHGERPALAGELPLPVADPGEFGLQPDDRLLETLAGGIARPRQGFVVPEERVLFVQQPERGVEVGDVVEDPFDPGDGFTLLGLVDAALRVGFGERHPAAEIAGAEPGQGLGHGDAAGLGAHAGFHAPDRLAHAQGRVRECGDLRDALPGGPVARPGRE